jgi:indolepyruvate ferredoxin oxidoreductase
MLPVLRVLQRGRALRGTPFDVFGYTQERRAERSLVERYTATVEALLPALHEGNIEIAVEIASLPDAIRGFGHVKEASMEKARAKEAELIARFHAPPQSATLAAAS